MTQDTNPEDARPGGSPPPASEPPPDEARRAPGWGAVFAQAWNLGRDAVALVRGKPVEESDIGEDEAEQPAEPRRESLAKRLNVLHTVTEQLRGAADDYVAAKLDEMEARVDAKLEEIERRLDGKMVQLHKQLTRMRDRELQHRLRLLKITLIFTVLVAVISLVYKWVEIHWIR
jgi:hypothetical protein